MTSHNPVTGGEGERMSDTTSGTWGDTPLPYCIHGAWLIHMPDGSGIYSRSELTSATDKPLTTQEILVDYLCKRLTGKLS